MPIYILKEGGGNKLATSLAAEMRPPQTGHKSSSRWARFDGRCDMRLHEA
jgi:hypothetical protein